MKYQKGKFILFYDCLVVNQKVFIELSNQIHIKKYRVGTSLKRRTVYFGHPTSNIKEKLHSLFPQYDMDNLMDPYKYIKE